MTWRSERPSGIVGKGECAAAARSERVATRAGGRAPKLRVNPNVLATGDVVAVPAPEPRQQACAIDSRHTFRIKASAEVYR